MSYIVKYQSADPKRCLLGGVHSSESEPYQHRADAMIRLASIVDVHAHLDTPLAVLASIEESPKKPGIVRHCGKASQAVGAICPDCKQQIPR